MVPTAAVAGGGDMVLPDEPIADEPIPEVEAELDAADHDTFEAFLHTVRTMVHGDEVPVADPGTDLEHDDPGVAEDDLSDWLPGVWQTEVVPARRRGGARRAEKRSRRIPRQDSGQGGEQARPATADGAEAVGVRRERRRRRRQDAARAIAAAVPVEASVEEPVEESAGGSVDPSEVGTVVATKTVRRVRRRDRRDLATRAQADPVTDVTDSGVDAESTDTVSAAGPAAGPGGGSAGTGDGSRRDRPRRQRESRSERAFARAIETAVRRGESDPPPNEPATLGEHIARVDAGVLPRRSRRSRPRTSPRVRRTAKITVPAAVIGACLALPWVAPSVPRAISDLFPGQDAPAAVEDPVVTPPSGAFVGPIGVGHEAGPLEGVRLQAAGEPREVRVARLHVDSQVVPISGQSGALLPPSDPQVLGWWQEGQEVGAEEGTAVVTGHTVHTGGGALDQLDKLVVGDEVRVRTDAGWIRYVVQRTRIFSKDELASNAEQLFRLDGPGRLVLITCDDWNGSFYESNAVVFATPAEDLPGDLAD